MFSVYLCQPSVVFSSRFNFSTFFFLSSCPFTIMIPCLFLGVLYLRLSVFIKGWRSTQKLMKTVCGEDTRASLKHLEAGRPAEAVQSATPGSAFLGSFVPFHVFALPAALWLLIFCPSDAFAGTDPAPTSNLEPTNLVLVSQLTRLISGLLG